MTTSTLPAANAMSISLLSLTELKRDKPATFIGNPEYLSAKVLLCC